MRSRKVAFLMTAAMVLSLMGCGTGTTDTTSKDSSSTTEAKSTESAQAATDKGEGNELTVWCWDPAFNIYAMNQAGEFYKKDHADFKLNVIETPWEDIQTKLTTAATSGKLDTLPDIILMQDNAFQKNQMSYPEAFTDLTDAGIDFSQFANGKQAYSTIDGKHYGVPFDNGAVIGCYRTDVLKEAGYTVDDFTGITWSQYIEKGKDVLAKTGKPLLSMQAGESDLIMMMLQSAGSSLFDDKGNANIVNNDVLKEVMSVYAELVKSGVMIEVNDWDQYVGSITNSTVAGTVNGCWIMASIQTAADQSGKWAITDMPSLEKAPNATHYSNNGGSSWAITSNCKNVKLAEDFLAKTFAGSVPFYEAILPSSGALATYLPAASSDVYSKPQEFFGGDAVYAKITDFASKVPTNNTGVYYYEARDAVATAIANVVAGADINSELEAAQSTVNFAMGK